MEANLSPLKKEQISDGQLILFTIYVSIKLYRAALFSVYSRQDECSEYESAAKQRTLAWHG